MLKAIVFDFDGVIVDSEPMHHRAMAQIGQTIGFSLDYPTYMREFIGFDDRDAFRHMLAQLGKPDDDQSLAPLIHAKAQVFEQLASQSVSAIPGALDLIDAAVANGLPIAIASGATRADIDLMLGSLGRTDRFATIVTADDVARSKPDPASYALAAQRLADRFPDLAIAPGDCLAIEDTAAGLQSAADAGLMTLGLTTTGPASALARAQRVVDTLTGITPDTLRQWYND